ncbi:MAG: 3-methyl-2-oxobutanoate hydroxymethyltransferase, partial [Pseudomonadota bacterium]
LDAHADLLLVGDSVAMVHHGHETTIPLSLDAAILHTETVVRTTTDALVVIDMPFGSYEESPEVAFRNAARAMKESGAQAVKLEGGASMADTIAFLTQRGVPVMAHIGLLPQSVHVKGGYKTTGKSLDEWPALEADGLAVAEAGAFAVVIEGMAAELAGKITQRLAIPTIGIGASPDCDGQILVTEDLLGLTPRQPKFVRVYAEVGLAIEQAVMAYAEDVKARRFPGPDEVYAGPSKKPSA